MKSRLLLTLLVVCASRVFAQEADVTALLANGRIGPAESLLFQAATVRPHDPEARIALGRYLASRGAFRVAAVLLEEARMFGADPSRVARDLSPLYLSLGDYQALVTLARSPLSAQERAQAVWFVSNQPTLEMDDSVVVAYREPTDTGSFGRVAIEIGSVPFEAVIDPRRRGIVLDASRRKLATELFATERDSGLRLGALEVVRIGDVALGNVPVAFERLESWRRAVIGLDVIAKLAPTFDGAHGRLVLRRGRIGADHAGERVPVLMLPDGVRALDYDRFVSLTGAAMLRRLHGRSWTLDVRRGVLVLEP